MAAMLQVELFTLLLPFRTAEIEAIRVAAGTITSMTEAEAVAGGAD